MSIAEVLKSWGGALAGGVAILVGIWNRFGIKMLSVKTDGLLEWRSRADRAEAKLEEKDDVRDRAEKEQDRNK